MLLKHLQYLVALSSERHFARAAERCAITQPTLSLALRTLEDDLGVPIVERGNRFLGLTPHGEIVVAWARRLLADELSLRQELALAKLQLRGRLRVGVIPSAIALVPALTQHVLGRHPFVEIEAVEMSSSEMLRRLALYELDAGIAYVNDGLPENVRIRPLATEEFMLAAPADWDGGDRATVPWRDAARLPLCLLDTQMQNRRIIDAAFASAGAKPNVKIETNSIMSTLFHVRAGTIATIVARSFAESLGPLPGIRFVPLVEPEIRTPIGLIIASRDHVAALVHAIWSATEPISPPA